MNTPSIDEVLNKAFMLASFILGDRKTAVRIVEEATGRLNVTTAAQGKRLYYKPIASPWLSSKKSERYRNKVLFSELHLLQRLIYIASEPIERLQEESLVASDVADEQMLIHFIKHLVRITTRRNSFYVTLGINRLLYNYTTAETMDTYNAVIQDPARVKDDYYYRSRKGVLMQELKSRFGSFLEITRGPRGEERFRASRQQGLYMDLVRECLSFFTPWDTFCLVPAGVNPIVDGIADLSSRNMQDEDKIEVDRIHAVLHPDCYSKLINLLGFDSPNRRLEAPHFFLSKENNNSGEGPGGQRRNPSNLSNNELDEIKGHLDDQSARRKRVMTSTLRILVDGKEQARLMPSQSGTLRFELDNDAELIEVRSIVNGEDLLLASHLFNYHETATNRPPDVTSIVLEGGQKIAITVMRSLEASVSAVEISYRETALVRLASLYLKRLIPASSTGNQSVSGRWNPIRVPALALSVLLLLISVIGVVQFLRKRNAGSSQPETATINRPVDKPSEAIVPTKRVDNDAPVNTDTTTPLANTPVGKDERSAESRKTVTPRASDAPRVAESNQQEPGPREPRQNDQVVSNRDGGQERASTTERATLDPGTTRSKSSNPIVVPLVDVKKIYVEVVGHGVRMGGLRQSTIARLSETNRFSATTTKDDADALLRLTVKRESNAQMTVRVVLINARGEVIWEGRGSRGMFVGSTENVAVDIVKGLLDDVSAINRRQ